MEKIAGLIYGPDFHYLDHLAPLCALLDIPLILTDTALQKQGQAFYPDLKLIAWEPFETPERLVSSFDTIIYCTPRVLFDQIFFFAEAFHKKRIQTIWCPHGNSDKGRSSPLMEALKGEELLLTYGPRIEAFLKEKGINVPTKRIGNFRLAYYEKHKQFYDRFFPKEEKPVILYGPTWQDGEHNSSFPYVWPQLLKAPEDISLMIKLHPNLYQQYPDEIEILKSQLPPHVTLLENFPPVYPILARTDLFIGDMSSVGYDFLAFERPMLMLTRSELTQVSHYLDPQSIDTLFDVCKKLLRSKISSAQKSLYEETFDVKPLDIPNFLQDFLPPVRSAH